jgi:single-strand DNA-binding protein
MNVLSCIGNIGQDAELRFLPNATPVCQFSFALSSGFGDKQVTTWLRCSVYGKRAETLAPMLTKGTRIGITGELTNREYADKSGVTKQSLEVRVSDVTLLGSKSDAVHETRTQPKAERQDMQSNDPMGFDDDLPDF